MLATLREILKTHPRSLAIGLNLYVTRFPWRWFISSSPLATTLCPEYFLLPTQVPPAPLGARGIKMEVQLNVLNGKVN